MAKTKTQPKKANDYTPSELAFLRQTDPVEKRAAWIAEHISNWDYDSLQDFADGIDIIVRVRSTGEQVIVVPPDDDWDYNNEDDED